MNVSVGESRPTVVNMRAYNPDILASIFTRVDLSWSKGAHAKFVMSPLGDLSLIRSTHTAKESKSRRLERHMVDQDEGYYFGCIPLEGAVEINRFGRNLHRGHASQVKANHLTLLNTQEEYEIAMSDTLDAIWLRIPAKLLKSHVISVDDLLGRPLNVQSGLGLMAKQMMLSVVSEQGRLPNRSARILSQTLLCFLGDVINSNLHSNSMGAQRGRRKILKRAQEFIEEHMLDDELNPLLIAQGIGISSRYLSEIFASEGTSPMRWVRKRRLEMCRMELECQSGGQQLICEVAYSMGFTNVSSFNRAFKAHFGQSPRDLLAQD